MGRGGEGEKERTDQHVHDFLKRKREYLKAFKAFKRFHYYWELHICNFYSVNHVCITTLWFCSSLIITFSLETMRIRFLCGIQAYLAKQPLPLVTPSHFCMKGYGIRLTTNIISNAWAQFCEGGRHSSPSGGSRNDTDCE